jgi:methyl-accepting chemotaxis protein
MTAMKLSSFNIKTRFLILIAFFVCGFSLYGAWSFMTLNEIKVNGPIYQRIVQSKDLIADILPPPEYIIESYLVTLQLPDAPNQVEQSRLIDRLKALKADYDSRHEFWNKQALESDIGQILLQQAHLPVMAFYAVAFDEFIPALRQQNKEGASAALAKMKGEYETHRKAIDQVVELTGKRAVADETQAKDAIRSATWLMLVILAASLTASVVVAEIIIRSLLQQLGGELHIASSIAGRIAAGDLGVDIKTKDEDRTSLMYALKTMRDSLAVLVGQARSGADAIATASNQIASGNLDLSSRTEQQVGSLEQTAAAMEALTSTVRLNVDNALQANQLALSASEVASRGGKVVSQVVDTMTSINESSKKIVDIIGVIDGIAFQTNILALNAAVEAARAGEQGRGFAVVAGEVRSLAQRSANAAKEIKTLIGDSVTSVERGAALVSHAGTTMDEIVASISRVTQMIGAISASSREQNAEIEQINHAIGSMDKVTQQNATLVEQAAAAAKALNDEAGSLVRVVSVFKMEGSRAIGLTAARAPA